MADYAVVQLDLSPGREMQQRGRFRSREEAMARLTELRRADPQGAYLVQLVPGS